ncbi:MAG: MBL fold metallo-hydrolase [Christensenellales bacterium]
MKLTVLGCDGSYPGPDGACSGYLVTDALGNSLLMDCGSGVLPRLTARMDPAELTALAITHWHNDHACDLLTLRYYLQIHKKRLIVYAPTEPAPLRALCEGAEFDLRDISQGFHLGELRASVLRVNHPLPAYAIKLAEGGSSLVYTGDASATPGLQDFCRGADLLVCDATFTLAQWHDRLPHMSAAMAGALGAEAGVKRLLLTHCQPGSDHDLLLHEARAHYPAAQWAEHLAGYSV